MYYYYGADGNGLDSVADIIEANKKDIVALEVGTFEQFDKSISALDAKIAPGDTIILDTLDALASMWRIDAKLGTDPSVNLWDKRQVYFGDKNSWGAYTGAGEMILRRLKNCRNRGANIIVLCHEAEREDETVFPKQKKRAPDVNPALLSILIASASDVFRLTRMNDAVTNADGETVLPAGARLLQLHGTEEYIAKFHVSIVKADSIAPALSRPSYPKLCKHLGKTPSFLVIYSPPGVGKTTFAFSAFMDKEGKGIGK